MRADRKDRRDDPSGRGDWFKCHKYSEIARDNECALE